MTRTRRLQRRIGILLAWSLLALPATAEVSIAPTTDDGAPNTIVMAITDHPDPINVAAWSLISTEGNELVLNSSGGDRGDGRPDFAFFRGSSRPFVVWAYNTGTDFDIAYSEWLGVQWSPIGFLTNVMNDETDPRVAIMPDRTVHVVWSQKQTNGVDAVFHTMRHPDNTWASDTIMVTDSTESARRPSILPFGGEILIAYERDAVNDGDSQEVVLVLEKENFGYEKQVLAQTPRLERLDVILHTNGAWVWVDWKHGDREFGRAVNDGSGWGNWSTVVWEDDTWVGVEEVRHQIQNAVLP